MSDGNPKPTDSKIIPNTFQKPNWIVDVVMRYLPGEHYKCLDVVVRKTLGWLKERDRISTSQIVELTGIGKNTVYKCMKDLCEFGLVLKTDGNNASNQGNEWALQLDDRRVNLSGLMDWDGVRRASDKRRVSKTTFRKGGIPSNGSTPIRRDRGVPIRRDTQKTLSKDNKISLSRGEPDFANMTVLQARSVPTLQMFSRATGFFPGSVVWETVHEYITEHKLTEERIKTAAVAWKLRGYREGNIEGILEWARDGVPPKTTRASAAKSKSKTSATKRAIIDGVLANG